MNLIISNGVVIACYPGYQSLISEHPGCSEMFVPEETRLKSTSQDLGWEIPTISETLLWGAVRSRRDLLLSGTDWTQLEDINLSGDDRNEYRVYRERLRAVPQVFGLVKDVIWPELNMEEWVM